MAAMNCKAFHSVSCCGFAAGGTSARNIAPMDTAVPLVVSICVLCLDLLRILLSGI